MINPFIKRNTAGTLCVESCRCDELAAQYGTPLYVYSRATIEAQWRAFAQVLSHRPHLICYAVKANSNLAILDVLARLGSGFDIVSVGELERVRAAGCDLSKVVFSGVGKQHHEMERALALGIRCFNVESPAELQRLGEVARAHGSVAPVSLRINPDVDAKTHPYISTGLRENKFGIAMDQAIPAYEFAAGHSHLQVTGIDCHIGSQLTDVEPYRAALLRLAELIHRLSGLGIAIEHIDVGGGQGIRYRDEQPIDLQAWSGVVDEALAGLDIEVLVEPGRAIVGNAGVLLARIEYIKSNGDKHFLVVDTAMNDLIRPALYSAWQQIEPVQAHDPGTVPDMPYDIVGPVCESADFLGKERELRVQDEDLLAIMSSGAYAFVMASNYNTRARAAEVLVDGDQAYLVRERETLAQLFAGERLLPGNQASGVETAT